MKIEWEWRPLGDLCDILDSQRKPITKRDRTNGAYPYYGATGVVDYVDDFIFDEPIVLVGEDGAKWASGEQTAFHVEGKCWVNNHAHVLRPHRTHILDGWLVYYLNHADLTAFVSGLTVPKLNQGSIRGIPLPVPPIAEQRRIVSVLDEAFAGLATAQGNVEKNLENARALFEIHLQSVFNEHGKAWHERRLGDLFAIGSSKRVRESEWTSSGVPFYGGREIVRLARDGFAASNNYISEKKYQELASRFDMPKPGDILMTARGTIGVGYVVKAGDKFYYKDGNLISLREKVPTNPRFVLYAFRSKPVLDQIADLSGATVTHLPIERANALILRIPSISTQNSIVENLRSFEAETQHLEGLNRRKLAILTELGKSLLDQAFSGTL